MSSQSKNPLVSSYPRELLTAGQGWLGAGRTLSLSSRPRPAAWPAHSAPPSPPQYNGRHGRAGCRGAAQAGSEPAISVGQLPGRASSARRSSRPTQITRSCTRTATLHTATATPTCRRTTNPMTTAAWRGTGTTWTISPMPKFMNSMTRSRTTMIVNLFFSGASHSISHSMPVCMFSIHPNQSLIWCPKFPRGGTLRVPTLTDDRCLWMTPAGLQGSSCSLCGTGEVIH